MRSALMMAAKPNDIEFIVRTDDDDTYKPDIVAACHPFQRNLVYLTGERGRTSDLYNECAEGSSGDNIMLGADDAEFMTAEWDQHLCPRDKWQDGIFCVWPVDGVNSKCTFPVIGREWYKVTGEFACTIFEHTYIDSWLHRLAAKLKRAALVKDVMVYHHHFSLRRSEFDENYRYRRRDDHGMQQQDHNIWRSDQAELIVRDQAALLANAMVKA